jgi:hypothetical protein
MAIRQIRVVYSGLTGLPGVSTHYCDTGATINTVLSSLRTFYNSCAAYFPVGLTVAVQNTGNDINETTGALVGTWSGTAVSVVSGAAGSGRHAAGVGACVSWLTTTVGAHRFLHARSFLVPLETSAYQADGSIDGSALSTFTGAAISLLTAIPGDLYAWHRPVGGSGGSTGAITGSRVPDRVATLKTRR